MEVLYVIIATVVAIVLVSALRKRRPPKASPVPESTIRIAFDEERIRVTDHTGAGATLGWDAIGEVSIHTTDGGPWLEDVYWRLHNEAGEVVLVIPNGATGVAELLEALQARLPGFDLKALIDAMGCADNRLFVLWQKENVPLMAP